MSTKSYLAQTRVNWSDAHKQERECMGAWLRSEIGVNGEHWSSAILTSEQFSYDHMIRIITFNEDDHVRIMCTWG